MPVGRRSRYLAAALLVGTLVPLAASKDLDPAKQRDQQKKIQARIDEAARRAGSTIDAMIFQRLSPTAERKMLEEVAKGLRGLSDDQIKQVLDHLEAAAAAEAAKNMDKASAEEKAAFLKQREVIAGLRGMLVKLDVIKNLDEAAAPPRSRRGQATRRECRDVDRDAPAAPARPPRPDPRQPRGTCRRTIRSGWGSRRRLPADPGPRRPPLNSEQKDRVERANALSRGARLVSEMRLSVSQLRNGAYEAVSTDQRRHAKELQGSRCGDPHAAG